MLYLSTMSTIETIVEDLKALPPARLEAVAEMVRQFRKTSGMSQEERHAIFTRTAGALSAEEADEMERVIQEGCGRVASPKVSVLPYTLRTILPIT